MDPLNLLLLVLVVVAIAALIIWLIDRAGLPDPFNIICKVGVVVLALVYLARAGGFA